MLLTELGTELRIFLLDFFEAYEVIKITLNNAMSVKTSMGIFSSCCDLQRVPRELWVGNKVQKDRDVLLQVRGGGMLEL